jgi:hypothetical protein
MVNKTRRARKQAADSEAARVEAKSARLLAQVATYKVSAAKMVLALNTGALALAGVSAESKNWVGKGC